MVFEVTATTLPKFLLEEANEETNLSTQARNIVRKSLCQWKVVRIRKSL